MAKDRAWLARNSYPGRGLVVGCTADGAAGVQLYWIMGRSTGSRNRRLIREPDGSVRVVVADPAEGVQRGDPSLLLYRAMCTVAHGGGRVTHVVSNGDQTETIAAGLAGGESFIAAFSRRDVEPDPPHYTARIAGALTVGGTGGDDGPLAGCELAIVKAAGGEPPRTSHQHFSYRGMRPGWGYCITTYEGDGSPLPPFAGEPFPLPVATEPRQAVAELWDLLDRDNRVAAAAKFIDRAGGAVRIELINRHDGAGYGA
jgi:hypothetical protein